MLVSYAVVTSEIKLNKQFCFSFISDVVTCEIKQKQSQNNSKTILKRFRIVSVFCFCFISHVTTSEIKPKQNYLVSVLFQM